MTPSLIAPGGPLVRFLEDHTSFVNAVAVTPDGYRVVSGSADKTMRVWDLATGETKTTLQGHTSFVIAVETTQIAPTILVLLGLNPNELQAVCIEGTQPLF